MKRIFTIAVCLLFANTMVFAQVPKSIGAIRIDTPPKIDGLLDEEIWQREPVAVDFVEYLPQPGAPESGEFRTLAWIYYDNTGIYIAAKMYDARGDILREFTKRDDTGNSDWFSVLIDTYNDRINGYEFGVTSANIQFDKRYSASGSDKTWDAVWESKVTMTDTLWCVEIRIPFSAIRFAAKPEQVWGFNLQRYRRKTRQELYWNERKPTIEDYLSQWGTLENIQQIKPPLALSFSPYVSGYMEHSGYHTPPLTGGFNAGMDVKWGINESFVLDMTMIPDFGQVASDAKVHNLTPFEIEYNEKRTFFTEGTELFNKGGYFYSRRIGGAPVNQQLPYNSLSEHEVVTQNPLETQLINAVKISGRTAKGLGIGVFNAITAPMSAVIEDTLAHTSRKIETSPLSNYNVLVLDQSLKNNSYLSFVNTSVWRSGQTYDADVAALLFRFNNRGNSYYVEGKATTSMKFYTETLSQGYSFFLQAGKSRGNWLYYLAATMQDDKIDVNDLGLQKERNRLMLNGQLRYNNYTPTNWYSRWSVDLTPVYIQRYRPFDYEKFNISLAGRLFFKDYTMIDGKVIYQAPSNDYYEPKKNGRWLNLPTVMTFAGSFSSNYVNPFYVDISLSSEKVFMSGRSQYSLSVVPVYRFSERLSLSLTGVVQKWWNNLGYAAANAAPAFSVNDTVTIALRDRSVYETGINLRYAFTSDMNVTLGVRYYASKVYNKQWYFLDFEGDIKETNYQRNPYSDYHLFNVDMLYTWRFAPGSELNVVWKNEIQPSEHLDSGYFSDLKRLLEMPQYNNFSIKLIYYLDWLYFKKKS